MPIHGDESGLFWHEEVKGPAVKFDRPMPPDTGWKLPDGEADFPSLAGQGAIAVDVETYDPELKTKGSGFYRGGNARVVGIALGAEKSGFRRYYPMGHEIGPNLDPAKVIAYASEQLGTNQPKVGANLRYDLEALDFTGIKVGGPAWDVQNAAPLLNENKLSYALDLLGEEWLGEGKRTDILYTWLVQAFGEKNFKSHIWRAPTAVVGPYAESDVDLPLRIFAKQRPALEAQGLWKVFDLETRLTPLMLAMRRRGVPVDVAAAEQLSGVMSAKQAEIVAEIKRQSGIEPNIWAGDSLAKLFDAIGVAYPRTPVRPDGRGGQPSFRKEWLEHNPHPIARLVKDARKLDKFRETFLISYILEGNVAGRIHCMFNQLRSDEGGTISGRFSSSYPNLQNIPIRDKEFGKLIRAIFVPEEGQDWWALDWSQIEYRLIAHFAALLGHRLGQSAALAAEDVVQRYIKDPATDYHQAIADLTGLDRGDAKTLNFGLAYGQGLDLLCYNLGVDKDEGESIINTYHQRAPFIRPLARYTSNWVKKHGTIRTYGGRVRHFDAWEKEASGAPNGKITVRLEPGEYPEGRGWQRAFLHKTLNAEVQGSAADIMKRAMVDCHEDGVFDPSVLGAPHLTVHDELDGSVPRTKAGTEALAHVKHVMETCAPGLKVPLIAEGSTGTNWATAK